MSDALTPKSVTLSSEAKFFDRDRGSSDGSMISMTFTVPEDVTRIDLRALILKEKEKLDLFVLYSEKIKGTVSDIIFRDRRDLIRQHYNTLLGRKNGGEGHGDDG